MPRVLLFVDNFDHGGTQTQLVELANGLERSSEYEVHVGCLARRGPLLSRLEVPRERVTEYPLRRFYGARGLWQITRAAHTIWRKRIDLVHALDFYANVMCAAASGWRRHPPLVVSRRYHILSDRRIHRVGERWSYRLADAVVMNSSSVASEVADRGMVSPEKVVVIPNGIHLERFEGYVPEAGGPAERSARPRVGIVTRLCHDKGLETLIEATAALVPRRPDLEVVIVGEGESRPQLEALIAQHGVSGNVTLAGEQSDVRPWIATFDVAVLSSRREGLPNALLEYMAMGRPVVATRVGAIPEVLSEDSMGILVPPEDPPRLAAAIGRLLDDPTQRAALGRQGRKRVQSFAMDRMIDSTVELYQTLLNGGTTASRTYVAKDAPRGADVRHLR